MVGRGVLADEQAIPYLAIRTSLGDQPQHVEFSFRQPVECLRDRRSLGSLEQGRGLLSERTHLQRGGRIECLAGQTPRIVDVALGQRQHPPIVVDVRPPHGTIYVWAPVPEGYESAAAYCAHVLEESAVVISPGGAYGASGEGFFRISLTTPDERLTEAVERLRETLAK